jgi:hypothetical protein
MNWENYDRLVAHLQTMPSEEFNYFEMYLNTVGCVDCQCRVLMGHIPYDETISTDNGDRYGYYVKIFLGVTKDEARYIWCPVIKGDPKGITGIQKALYRLSVVAASYQRPSPTQAEREVAFLESVRALPSCELVEV